MLIKNPAAFYVLLIEVTTPLFGSVINWSLRYIYNHIHLHTYNVYDVQLLLFL